MFNTLKIIFAGTPIFAARHLDALLNKYPVVGVLTQPDRYVGRGKRLVFSPVKKLAIEKNLTVLQPESLIEENIQQQIKILNADIMVVVAYGKRLPKNVLKLPRLGCINVHASLLPRWRGAAPIQRSLCAGDVETGVTTIKMNTDIDAGDILHTIHCKIENTDTSATLYDKLSKLGSMSMLATLKQFITGTTCPIKQSEQNVSYATKISKQESRIDWTFSAMKIERYIRAFNPWPVSYFMIKDHMIRVWKASSIDSSLSKSKSSRPGEILQANQHGIKIATSNGILNIEELQTAGKKIMKVREFLKSKREWFTPGDIIN
ncbi:MAG: methionyl-tRNA formyltransferase [Candidatus Dasytiphilus stammeri]